MKLDSEFLAAMGRIREQEDEVILVHSEIVQMWIDGKHPVDSFRKRVIRALDWAGEEISGSIQARGSFISPVHGGKVSWYIRTDKVLAVCYEMEGQSWVSEDTFYPEDGDPCSWEDGIRFLQFLKGLRPFPLSWRDWWIGRVSSLFSAPPVVVLCHVK